MKLRVEAEGDVGEDAEGKVVQEAAAKVAEVMSPQPLDPVVVSSTAMQSQMALCG